MVWLSNIIDRHKIKLPDYVGEFFYGVAVLVGVTDFLGFAYGVIVTISLHYVSTTKFFQILRGPMFAKSTCCRTLVLILTPAKTHKNRRTCRRFLCIGRSNRIRTYDLYVPNVALYQAELYSDFTNNKQNFLMKALAIIEHRFSFATLFCNIVKKIL